MANRTVSRRKKDTDKGPAGKAKGRGVKEFTQEEELFRQTSNQEIIQKKLIKLSAPILEQYGQIAFEELINRLETTIQEFNEEVGTLFTGMVDQSKEAYGRLKSLMDQKEAPEEEPEPGVVEDAGLSEFEKRLEAMEQGVAAGQPTFKIYTADPGRLMLEEPQVKRVLARAAELGARVWVHAEEGWSIEQAIAATVDLGETRARDHANTRPPAGEVQAVSRVLAAAEETGAAVHLAHLSTGGAVADVQRGAS